MAVNKVIYYGEVLVDMTQVSVNPDSLVEGKTALDATGELINGANPYAKAATDEEVSDQAALLDQALLALQGKSAGGDGSITPSGEIQITENGTYDVTEYASAVVNVEASGGWDINAFIDRSITEVNIPEGVTKIGDFAFRSCTKLTSVTLPSTLRTIGPSAFYSTKITTLDVPNGVTTIGSNAYTSCTSLTTVFLPDTVTTLDTQCFRYDTKISKVTMGEGINSIGTYCFSGCSGLKAVIIRKTASVCPLSNTNAFSSSAISSKTGYIYVPRALMDSYKAAANWSTHASQFRALEDYTVDGTVTGELDESKI